MNRKVDSKTELGNIINLARGDRSLRNYAKDSGVSYNTIHMIEKGELNPSPEIIKKLTSKQASPQNGVTYEAVMSAAGYKTENDEAMVSEEALELAKHMLEEENEHSFLSPRVKQSSEYRENEIRRIKTLARGMVFDALLEKGIDFGVNSREESSYRLRNNDVLLTIDHGDIKKWLLTFMCTTGGSYGGLFYHDTLGRYMTFEGGKDIKFSWVTNDPRAFARYKGYEHKLLFRGEMSLILVDTDAQKIVSETYLSNYFLDDYSREFYIVWCDYLKGVMLNASKDMGKITKETFAKTSLLKKSDVRTIWRYEVFLNPRRVHFISKHYHFVDCFATHINVPRGLTTRYSVSLISRIFPFGKQLNKKLVVLFDVLRQRLVKLPKKEDFMLDKVINNQATCAKLKKMLEEKGYTPVEIKEMLHLESVQSVYKWYATARGKGTSMPSVDNMMRLAYLLKVPLEDIYVTYEILF